MNKEKLRIVPLGGLGEIGKNMIAYEYGDDILIVDSGIMFPENDMLGIDYIIPDFNYLLSDDKREKIRGIVITHGHEDHVGAISHVLREINVPIYGTPLTLGFVSVKLAKRGVKEGVELITIKAGESIQIGAFNVEFCHVCHSVPDGVALGITTPVGLVVHSGDYKFDHTPVDNWPTDFAKLAEWAGRGVLALLSDSTNADKPGWTPSERVIDAALDDVFRDAEGRIIIASFASLISRIQQVMNAAERHGRKMALVGMSMLANYEMACNLGYLDEPKDVVIDIKQALKLPEKEVVLMCTGSQGEPTSIMGRLANNTNRQFNIQEGDTVVLSSHPIPGNEENVFRTINKLFKHGANVIYDPIKSVHVSGHASQEEMKLLLNLVKPKYLIPIHGEIRHLRQHGKLAEEVGIKPENIGVIENGTIVEFYDGKMEIGERIPGGYVFVDGNRVGEIGPAVVREREVLSREGIVTVSLLLNKRDKSIIGVPEISTQGFVYKKDSGVILDSLVEVIEETVSKKSKDLEQDIKRNIRSALKAKTRRRPMIFLTIHEI
jgi:ribonuclease J